MPDQWYFAQNERKFGPVSSQKLKALAQSGQLKTADLIWKEGMENWVQADRLKGLFVTASNSATVPPPLKANPPAGTKPPVAAGTDPANTQQAAESNQSEPSATPRADKCAVVCFWCAIAYVVGAVAATPLLICLGIFLESASVEAFAEGGGMIMGFLLLVVIVCGLIGLKSTKRRLAILGLAILLVFILLFLVATFIFFKVFVLSPMEGILNDL